MPLTDKLKGVRLGAGKKPPGPLWKGPEEDGVTFSLLSRFLVCRERFRLLVVEGLRPDGGFNHRVEYGQMWHVCEEALAGHFEYSWAHRLKEYCSGLCKRYPTDQQQIDKWYNVCLVQFPVYVAYWAKHPDVKDRVPLLQEQVFNVPYRLPSGRTVRLRGKWDSVDLIGKDGVYLQENKTKGDIREGQIKSQLTFDLQTMMYLVALREYQTGPKQYRLGGEGIPRGAPVAGVRYNVIRRPLSGGKGTIVRHKPTKKDPAGESAERFYGRVAQYIKDDPGSYFARWRVEVSPADADRFRRECLDPVLEALCKWWDWVENCHKQSNASPFLTHGTQYHGIHWRHPFGVYNVLDEGGSSDLDEYLHTGSTAGLARADTLFAELEG